jgi:putative ABC transport system substrate-binding protein
MVAELVRRRVAVIVTLGSTPAALAAKAAERFGVLVNPSNPNAESLTKDVQAAGSSIGRQIEIFAARTARDIDAVFVSFTKKRADALVVSPDPLLDNRRLQIVTLAAHQRLPAIYSFRENVDIGGFMSYGSSAEDRDRAAAVYAGRILKGEAPGSLPVMRAAKFEFVFNLQTARALGLDVRRRCSRKPTR